MINTKKIKDWLHLLLIAITFIYPAWRLIPWMELTQISDFFQYYAVSALMQTGHYALIYDPSTILKAEQALVPQSLHSYFPLLNTTKCIMDIFSFSLLQIRYFYLCLEYNIRFADNSIVFNTMFTAKNYRTA